MHTKVVEETRQTNRGLEPDSVCTCNKFCYCYYFILFQSADTSTVRQSTAHDKQYR